MTRKEAADKLCDAYISLESAKENMGYVLQEGREHFNDEEAEWLQTAIEWADDAEHALKNRSGYDRIGRMVDREKKDG